MTVCELTQNIPKILTSIVELSAWIDGIPFALHQPVFSHVLQFKVPFLKSNSDNFISI